MSNSRIAILGTCGAVLVVGIAVSLSSTRSVTPEDRVANAEHLLEDGAFAQAIAMVEPALSATDLETANAAAFIAGQAAYGLGNYVEAVEFLEAIARTTTTTVTQPALLLRAMILDHDLNRIGDAISAFRDVLTVAPANLEANNSLARLLGMCGLRDAAVPHALAVIAETDSDLVILLARESAVIDEEARMRAAIQADPSDPYPRFALAAYSLRDRELESAEKGLRDLTESSPLFAPAWAMRAYTQSRLGDMKTLAASLKSLPESANAFAATWIARADFAEHVGDPRGAIRCYLEATQLRPESREASSNLTRLLNETGHKEEAAFVKNYLDSMHKLDRVQFRVLFSQTEQGEHAVRELVDAYAAAGRLNEAAFFRRVGNPTGLQINNDLASSVVNSPTLVNPEFAPASRVYRSEFPLPQFKTEVWTGSAESDAIASNAIRFRDDAAECGLTFEYDNATDGNPELKMYEFPGGGVGVIDFDSDGTPDIFLSQGGRRNTERDGSFKVENSESMLGRTNGDRLYRNRGGRTFVEVHDQAGLSETEFGQGIAVGDVNNDGFSDIYVGNIGPNVLWTNNGDGTFSRVGQEFADSKWTSSALLVDVDNDGLPDIYDVNYVAGDEVLTKTCLDDESMTVMCMPFHFEPASDQAYLNNGDGTFSDATHALLANVKPASGLGAVAWFDSGNSLTKLFVANDTMANNLLHFDEAGLGFADTAPLDGLAYNSDGKAEGCMGIAVADLNGDGAPDIHVTNFLAESNTLYMSDGDRGYRDQTRSLGLSNATWNQLAFGTQFFDSNLDGAYELFVANGHIQDLRRSGRPYRMQPQLFAAEDRVWRELRGAGGPYFDQELLGRSVAKIDWNRDGAIDLVVTHLESPVALLTATPEERGNYIRIRLIGTESSRDGFGATVSATIGGKKVTHHVCSGAGYMAENERTVLFGLGHNEEAVSVIVQWPSGLQSVVPSVEAASGIAIVEGMQQEVHDPRDP